MRGMSSQASPVQDKAMKSKTKKTCIIILILAAFLLACTLYTRPKHIQDSMKVIHIKNGECHTIRLDLYEKRSLLQPTVFYGSIWVDEEEYVRSYDGKISFGKIKQKFQDLFSSSDKFIGTFYNRKIQWPTEEYKWPSDDSLFIANYQNGGYKIRLSLSGQKCPFPEGTYVDEETYAIESPTWN